MRDKAQWDAVVSGKASVANRSPLASEVTLLSPVFCLLVLLSISKDGRGHKINSSRVLCVFVLLLNVYGS